MRAALAVALLTAGGFASQLPAAGQAEVPFQALWCPVLEGKVTGPLEVCNVRASAATGPASEIDLAMDPRDPMHLVAVAKAYNYTRTLYDQRGQPDLSEHRDVITNYATSFDGGLTWTEGYLQAFTPVVPLALGWGLGFSEEQGSDPVVEFAPDGSVLAVSLRVTQYPRADGLPVFRSTDGGKTFQRLMDAYPLGQPDKQWVVTDHARGIVYVATSDFAPGRGGIWVTRSLDGGRTWSAPVKACGCFHPGIDVGPGGEVYISGFGGGGIQFTRSLDLGSTWSPPVRIAALNPGGSIPGRVFRTPNIPVLAASHVDGGVYVAYAHTPAEAPPACHRVDAMCDDVFLAISHDRGATWRSVRVNDDPLPAEQFMPTVAVSPNGRDVHVAWMDQRHDPTGLTMMAYYAHSPDRGLSWEPNLRLSDLPSPVLVSFHQNPVPVVSNGWFVGDYIGLQASDGRAVAAFPDTRYGRADIFIATVV